jgi:hypothetical protein
VPFGTASGALTGPWLIPDFSRCHVYAAILCIGDCQQRTSIATRFITVARTLPSRQTLESGLCANNVGDSLPTRLAAS